jgi:regulator of sigma E protease
MTLLHTILAFVIALGTLVIVHELGHYSVARLCGVKVLRFSVGMGRVIYSRRFGRDQTEWAISILPLGGYVKMLDARDQSVATMKPEDLSREFTRQSVWRRIAIVAAGPLANFLLAIAVFAGLYMYGMPEPVPKLRAPAEQTVAFNSGLRGGETIESVNGQSVRSWSDVRWQLLQLALEKKDADIVWRKPDTLGAGGDVTASGVLPLNALSAEDLEGDFLTILGLSLARPPAILGKILEGPAADAGLQSGDRILTVDGVTLQDGLAFVEAVRASPGRALQVTGVRDGAPFTATMTPEAHTEGDQTFGRVRVEVPLAPEMSTVSETFGTAIVRGAQRTWNTSILTLKMIGRMIIGEVSLKNITGPITIADYAGQTARIGLASYLSFIAFISISLGVMNLLPIPVLDGGHLLYYLVEIVTGKPVSERVGEIAQRAGLGILLVLMLVAAFNDIVRLIL